MEAKLNSAFPTGVVKGGLIIFGEVRTETKAKRVRISVASSSYAIRTSSGSEYPQLDR